MVLGNWKSHGDPAMMYEFANAFHELVPELAAETVCGIAVPFHLLPFSGPLRGLAIGAQNVSAFGEGAFTGEIHADMLRGAGCEFCLVGHSERRQLLGESVEDSAAKLDRLLHASIPAVLCIGETLPERESGVWLDVLAQQLEPVKALESTETLAVAYEPVWAIGTGVAAQPRDVAETHDRIREMLPSAEIPILYGGSVKPGNASELASIGEVGGFLIGGASLKPADFAEILQSFVKAKQP